MAVSMLGWSEAQAAHGKSPVYTYEFARPHTYAPGAVFSDLNPSIAGAYHTSEVPFWLGTLDSFNAFRTTRAWTSEDRAFSLGMTDALIRFARTGDPGAAAAPWPKFDADRPMLMHLGDAFKVSAWPDARRFDFFRKFNRPRPRTNDLRD